MARSTARARLVPFVLVLAGAVSRLGALPCAFPAGGPAPQGSSAGERARDPLDEIRPYVGDVRRNLERNAPTAARELLRGAVKRLQKLGREGVDPAARVILLAELDELATKLGEVGARLWLRQEIADEHARFLPAGDPVRLAAQTRLAEALAESGDCARARVVLEETRALLEEHRGPEHPETLAARHVLALALACLGELELSEVHLEAVLATRIKSLGNEHEDTLQTKQDLARVRRALGDVEGARVLLEDVVAVREGALGTEAPAVLQAKGDLAEAREETGDLTGAENLLEQLLRAKRSGRQVDPVEIEGLSQRLASLGERRQSLEALRAAAGGPSPPGSVPAPGRSLPGAWQRELRQRAAVESFRRFAEGRWGVPAGLPATINHALGGYGALAGYHAFGAYGALGLRGALGAYAALGGYGTSAGGAVRALAAVQPAPVPIPGFSFSGLDEQGPRPASPPPIDPEALLDGSAGPLGGLGELVGDRLRTAGSPGSSASLAELQWLRLGQAGVEFAGDRPETAALELEHILTEGASRVPPDDPGLVEAKRNLAFVQRDLGELERARALLEEVEAAEERLLPSDHPALHETREELSWTYCELDLRAGTEDWRAELQVTLAELLRGMRERTRLLWARSAREAQEAARVELDRLGRVLSLLDATALRGVLEREVFEALETLRSVSVVQPGIARALRDVPALAERARERARASEELQDALLAGPRKGETAQAFGQRVLGLARKRDELDEEVHAGLAGRGLHARALRADELARTLPAGAASVSLLRYEREAPRGQDGAPSAPRGVFVAFLLEPSGELERIELGSAAELERLVLGWRAELGRALLARGEPVRLPAVSAGELAKEGLAALLVTRLAPVISALGEARTLHLVLDDVLHLVPLEALPLADGALLGERFAVRHEISLARLLAPAPEESDEPAALLVGGIDYEAQPSLEPGAEAGVTPPLERAGGAVLKPLQGAADEVRALAELFRRAFERAPRILSGAQATKGSLREALASARFVHLATHGWFASDQVLSRAEGVPAGTGDPAFVLGFAPRVLCGLALAGANRGVDELGRASGILTAEELAGYELGACELAVLSACETNVGLRRAGQGVQSLQSALHAAGARTAVTSLWKVDDEATRLLMERFYGALWSEHRSPAAALWAAKMSLRAEGRGPADWAGWILTGAAE